MFCFSFAAVESHHDFFSKFQSLSEAPRAYARQQNSLNSPRHGPQLAAKARMPPALPKLPDSAPPPIPAVPAIPTVPRVPSTVHEGSATQLAIKVDTEDAKRESKSAAAAAAAAVSTSDGKWSAEDLKDEDALARTVCLDVLSTALPTGNGTEWTVGATKVNRLHLESKRVLTFRSLRCSALHRCSIGKERRLLSLTWRRKSTARARCATASLRCAVLCCDLIWACLNMPFADYARSEHRSPPLRDAHRESQARRAAAPASCC